MSSKDVQTYTSAFMRSLKSCGFAKQVPNEILQRYSSDEYYDCNQQFDPEKIARIQAGPTMRLPPFDTGNSHMSSKDDAVLQPQRKQTWKQGCGANVQGSEPDSQSSQPTVPLKSNATSMGPTGSGAPRMPANSVRAPGMFGNRTQLTPFMPSGAGRGTGQRMGQDLTYAANYRLPKEQDFRMQRPPFGRGRGREDEGGRFPNSMFSQRGGFGSNYGGGRGYGNRKYQSHSESVPEWFTDDEPSKTVDLHGFEEGAHSSSPPQSLEDEYDHPRKEGREAPDAELSKSAADSERPASQQMDYTLMLWQSIKNEIETKNEGSPRERETEELVGSKLWSWSTGGESNTESHHSRNRENTENEHSHWSSSKPNHDQKMTPNQQAPLQDPAIARFLSSGESQQGSRGMNPNDLFAKFSNGSGSKMPNAQPSASTVQHQPTVPHPPASSAPNRTTSPSGNPMSLEDLERRMLMKKKNPSDKPSEKHSQRQFFDNPVGQNQSKEDVDSTPSNVPPLNAIQMQLAAAQQAMMNAAAAVSGGGPQPTAQQAAILQQQKMLLANLIQQQQQQHSMNNNGQSLPGGPGMLGMLPPNALAMAAAAAMAAAQSAQQNPLVYYQAQLMQQNAASRSNNSNTANAPNQASNSQRPPFPIPPPGAFQNFPQMNPQAAANLMMAALNNMQQQKPASPGPAGSQQGMPNTQAATMAAAAALMSRMGITPPNMPSNMPQGQFPHQGQGHNAPPPQQAQQHQSLQQQHSQAGSGVNSPSRRAQSPAPNTSSSKVNASFIPTQVMMKNPHAAAASESGGSSAFSRSGRAITSSNKPGQQMPTPNQNKSNERPNGTMSYSSVASSHAPNDSPDVKMGHHHHHHQQQQQQKQWNAEDFEKAYVRNSRDGTSNNYNNYPPLHGQSVGGNANHQSSVGNNNQRTAGLAAMSFGASGSAGNRQQETAHQFSVADLLRGAANASNKQAAQSSSSGFS